MSRQAQGTTMFTGLLWLIGIDVMLQLWLLTAGLEALLEHRYAVLVPVGAVLLVLFLLNLCFYQYVRRFDLELRARNSGEDISRSFQIRRETETHGG